MSILLNITGTCWGLWSSYHNVAAYIVDITENCELAPSHYNYY